MQSPAAITCEHLHRGRRRELEWLSYKPREQESGQHRYERPEEERGLEPKPVYLSLTGGSD